MSRRFQTDKEIISELERKLRIEREALPIFAEELRKAKTALKLLHDDTADYIRVNNLGRVHHNYSMKQAAIVLGIQIDE